MSKMVEILNVPGQSSFQYPAEATQKVNRLAKVAVP
jgi:hypothetical protein